ncbi:HNH endonuclease signature motif containing protein [Rhodococcus sp. MTM3W5.2]|uniref:HNH endonuclease signature motif containing protein n=1 Tax=Rhodococcus sp. MTM3W5.2 TaxID=1805827 RepID=UPI00097CB3CF|nr:HNH endonuclease signature motif containing protein [Rhodococcus sp. MTM3W5.2]
MSESLEGVMGMTASVTDRERSLLEAISETARVESAAAARLIAQIMDYADSRGTFDHRAPGAGFDTEQAERSAIAEVALALSSTFRSVSSLMRLGFTLERMPEIRGAFAAGDVSLAKIRVIDEHTRKATAAAVLRLDADILSAAGRLAPTPLGIEIDRLLIEDDAAWAQRARDEAEAKRKVRSRRLPHGMGVLSVTLTATQLTAVTGLIVTVAKTVCRADPRPLDVRCADAFMVLMHGGRALTCECADRNCAATGNCEPAAAQVNLRISCGLETLLGLADNPAYLEGYGYLDAGQARAIAEDATWQAIIDCAAQALDRMQRDRGVDRDSADGVDDSGVEAGDDADPADETGIGTEPEAREPDPPDPSEAPDPCPASEADERRAPLPRSGLLVVRSRILPAGSTVLPVRKLPYPGVTSPVDAIDGLFRTILNDPADLVAAFPDGRGGFTRPPPGAMTYRPSDLLAAAVRLRDGTCRHPDCLIAAADCQIDHVVAFNRSEPILGGWTVLANLQCLCALHHQLKTAGLWRHEMLAGAIMHVYNTIGQHALTLPVRR